MVREGYALRALEGGSCCVSGFCCGQTPQLFARTLGYGEEEMSAIPRKRT
jgi:hypothetical protein